MKQVFTVLCITLVSLSVSAQTQFGVTLGANLASISGDDIGIDIDSRVGLRAGLSFSKELSSVVTLNSAVLYSVKGGEYKQETYILDAFGFPIVASEVDADYSLNYIELPVNFAFSVTDQFSLLAGFYAAFLVGVSNTVDGEDVETSTDYWAPIDGGIGVGAQISINDAISINAGYQMGLIPLDKDGETDARNLNILIGMTYNFGR